MADSDLDPQTFLRTVRDLSEKRQREDNERVEKLEADIVNDRNARLARRMDRERSLSPEKSVSYTPRSPLSTHSSAPSTPRRIPTDNDDIRGRPTTPLNTNRDASPVHDRPASPNKTSSPNAAMPSRANTMSWQRRPNSVMRDRPLSVVAAENHAARAPLVHTTSDITSPDTRPLTRTKSPRPLSAAQTPVLYPNHDNGRSSPTYRRNVDDELSVDRDTTPATSPSLAAAEATSLVRPAVRPQSQSLPPSAFESSPQMSPVRPKPSNSSLRSFQTLPDTSTDEFDSAGLVHNITPTNRSASPTKGIGGFVQSAMMKRTDSVSKRWSVNSGPGLSRENSVASVRSNGLQITKLDSPTMPKLKENRPVFSNLTRPDSYAAPSTKLQRDIELPRSLHGRSKSIATLRDPPNLPTKIQSTLSPPLSPSKRWNTSKSSWLESALSRPESPVASPTPVLQPDWMTEINKTKQQRNGTGVDTPSAHHTPSALSSVRSPQSHVHTPQMSASNATINRSTTKAAICASSPAKSLRPESIQSQTGLGLVGQSPIINSEVLTGTPRESSWSQNTPSEFQSPKRTSTVNTPRSQFSSPSKQDHRASPAFAANKSSPDIKEEPEFRNALGNLRRAKTENYVAPDVLKNNIQRGKAALNLTGGPQKTPRTDELKESLLKRKEEIQRKAAQSPPVPKKNPSIAQDATPEALSKRSQLGRTATVTSTPPRRDITPEALSLLKSIKNKPAQKTPEENFTIKTSPPLAGKRLALSAAASSRSEAMSYDQSTSAATTPKTGKVTDRMNPALATLLAKGPPVVADDNLAGPMPSQDSITAAMLTQNSHTDERALTHMNKTRAKGPNRRKPKDEGFASIQDAGVESISTMSAVEKPGAFAASASSKPTVSKPTVPSIKSALVRQVSIEAAKTPIVSPPTLEKAFAMPLANGPSSHRVGVEQLKKITTTAEQVKPPVSMQLSMDTKSLSGEPERIASPSGSPSMRMPSDENKENRSRGSVAKATMLWGKSPSDKPAPRPAPISLPKRQEELDRHDLVVTPPAIEDGKVIGQSDGRSSGKERVQISSKSPLSPPPTGGLPVKPNKSSRSVSATLRDMANKDSHNPGHPKTREIIEQYFGAVPSTDDALNIDVHATLRSRPGYTTDIRNSKITVQQINADGKVGPTPSNRQHVLYDTCMYVCTHAFETDKTARGAEAFVWIGSEVSPSAVEDVQIFTKRAANTAFAGSRSVSAVQVVYQTAEPVSLLQALGGIIVVRRGRGNETINKPYVLCGRPHAGFFAFDEIDVASQGLCSAFSYIVVRPEVDQDGKVILWKGMGCGPEAIGSARLTAMDLNAASEIVELDEGQDNAELAKMMPTHTEVLLEGFSAKQSVSRLFRVDVSPPRRPSSALFAMFTGKRAVSPSRPPDVDQRPTSATSNSSSAKMSPTSDPSQKPILKVSEAGPISQKEFDRECLYILDALDTILVLPGPQFSSSSPSSLASSKGNTNWQYAFVQALHFANVYAIMAAEAEDRSAVPKALVVLGDGGESAIAGTVATLFRRWDPRRGLWGHGGRQHGGLDNGGSLLSVDAVLEVCCPQTRSA